MTNTYGRAFTAAVFTIAFYSGFAQTGATQSLTAQPTARMLAVATGETLAVFASPEASAAVAPGVNREVVVILPGPVGSAFAMRHLTAGLAETHTKSVVVDLLGMGASPYAATANYSLSQQAVRLAAVLDSLGIGRAIIVAQGVSATVALRFAANDTARVAGVLSLSGGASDNQGTHTLGLAMPLARFLDNPIARALGRRKYRGSIKEQSLSESWNTDAVTRAYLAPYERDLRGSLKALKAMSEVVEPTPIAARLASVRAPVQLLVGDKVSSSTPTTEQIAAMQRGLATFRVDTIARSGTMLHEERPDAVLAAIRAMLSRVTLGVVPIH